MFYLLCFVHGLLEYVHVAHWFWLELSIQWLQLLLDRLHILVWIIRLWNTETWSVRVTAHPINLPLELLQFSFLSFYILSDIVHLELLPVSVLLELRLRFQTLLRCLKKVTAMGRCKDALNSLYLFSHLHIFLIKLRKTIHWPQWLLLWPRRLTLLHLHFRVHPW